MLTENEMAKPLIGEILIKTGEITRAQLATALEIQKKNGGLLGIILVCQGVIDEKTLVKYLEIQASGSYKEHGLDFQ